MTYQESIISLATKLTTVPKVQGERIELNEEEMDILMGRNYNKGVTVNKSLAMFLSGFVCGVILALFGAGLWAYIAVGSLPIIGGLAQSIMRKKINKVIDISPNGSKPVEPKIKFGKDIHSKHNRGD